MSAVEFLGYFIPFMSTLDKKYYAISFRKYFIKDTYNCTAGIYLEARKCHALSLSFGVAPILWASTQSQSVTMEPEWLTASITWLCVSEVHGLQVSLLQGTTREAAEGASQQVLLTKQPIFYMRKQIKHTIKHHIRGRSFFPLNLTK